MTADWPVLLPEETVISETRTPYAATALLCALGAALGLTAWWGLTTGQGGDPKGAALAIMVGALLAWLVQLPLTASRVIVTTHRVAIRRSFGQRYSLMFPQIADLRDNPLGIVLTTHQDDRRHLLAMIAHRQNTASGIRNGLEKT
jgi:nitrogen fixation-related uncharacterized protein